MNKATHLSPDPLKGKGQTEGGNDQNKPIADSMLPDSENNRMKKLTSASKPKHLLDNV